MDTREAASYIFSLDFQSLPSDVVKRAKLTLMDTIGVMLGGLATKAATIARRVMAEKGGKDESSLLGTEIRVPASQASFANCIAASALDFDDGNKKGGHPGAIVIPSAIAVGEAKKSSGVDLLVAVVVGYEMAIRVINLVREPKPGSRTASGTGTGGVYGSTTAACKLLGCTPEQIVHALGIAAIHAPITSPVTVWEDGYMGKECIGWAGITGVEAAYLALHGFTGPKTIFDLPQAKGTIADTLGSEYEILGGYFKPYPACRLTHPALDIIFEVVEGNGLTADDVVKVTVATREWGAALNSKRPVSIEQAQYSFPFVIGAALAYGRHSPATMTEEALEDPSIHVQADKVTTKADPSLSNERWPADVTIETADGRKFQKKKLVAKGEPAEPMSEQELLDKFLSLSTPVLGKEKAQEVLEMVRSIEDLPEVGRLTALLRVLPQRT